MVTDQNGDSQDSDKVVQDKIVKPSTIFYR